jgi:hypothetical protein
MTFETPVSPEMVRVFAATVLEAVGTFWDVAPPPETTTLPE